MEPPRVVAAPALPGSLLDRPVLAGLLHGVLARPLTVVSAPAGYGKTTMVAHWCATHCPVEAHWVEVDDADLVAIVPVLPTPGPDPQVVIVDDVTGPDTALRLDALARALRELPDVHVIAITRRQVASGLAGARLSGTIDVIHERHLRFDAGDMAALVDLVARVRIRRDLAQALIEELAGWPAGAMLLALDWEPSCTLANHRTVLAAAYRSCGALLAFHVLDGLGAEDRQILRDAAGLPAVGGELLNILSGRTDGDHLLHELREGGRFLTQAHADPPLDRFPRLVRAALRDPRQRGTAAEAAVLRVGADWYASHGLSVLATACLIELKDWDGLADLVLGNLFEIQARDELADLVQLLGHIPAAALQQRWSWTYGVAHLLVTLGELVPAFTLLGSVEPNATPAEMVVTEVLRASAVTSIEDPTPSLQAAERALALCDELGEDAAYPDAFGVSRATHWRVQAHSAAMLAGAYLGQWDRVATHERQHDEAAALELPAATRARVSGHRACYLALAGRLADAEREATRLLGGLRVDLPHSEHVGVAARVAMGDVLRGRGQVSEALSAFREAGDRASVARRPNLVVAAVSGEALVHLDAGRPDDALQVVVDHRRSTAHRPPPALRDRLDAAELVARHRIGDAALTRTLLDDPVRRGPVFAAAAAACHLEQGDLSAADRVVQQWPSDPTTTAEVHHALICAALAELRGQRAEATGHLEASLATAAPHGWVQPFAQLGVFVLRPLRIVADQATSREVGRHAQAAIAQIDAQSGALGFLTPRERLVLRHLTSPASLPDLAAQLTVSPNTLKTHVKAIYRKLGVASRAEAVAVWRASGELDAI